jgi:hypothetical protein
VQEAFWAYTSSKHFYLYEETCRFSFSDSKESEFSEQRDKAHIGSD